MFKIAYKKWNYKIWALSFVTLNLIICLIMVLTDPYRLMPFQMTIPGINNIKPRLYDYQRYIKLFDIAYQKPRTIILGSSRVLWGIDPKNAFLEKYKPVYNAGVLGPPMYEVREYFFHALKNQPELKRVILALDFYAFNSKFDNRDLILKDTFGKNWQEILQTRRELVFDFPAFVETFVDSLMHKHVKSLREDGRLTPDPLEDRELYKEFFAVLDEPKADTTKEGKAKDKTVEKKTMRNELYQPFHLSKIDLAALKEIIDTCKKRNIELYIYLPPVYNNTELVDFHSLNLWRDYQSFQRYLARLSPFWDFTSWNEIVMNKKNFIDGSHHTFAIGKMVLDRIMGHPDPEAPSNFGRYVTAANVDTHLKILQQEYIQHKDDHVYRHRN